MFVIQNVENFWAEMKVVTHRFIILNPFSFSTRAEDLKLKQTFFYVFLEDSYRVKYPS